MKEIERRIMQFISRFFQRVVTNSFLGHLSRIRDEAELILGAASGRRMWNVTLLFAFAEKDNPISQWDARDAVG